MKNQEIISRLKSLYESIYQPTIRDNPRLSLQIALALLIIEYKQLNNKKIIFTLSGPKALVVSGFLKADCKPFNEFYTCLYISCVRRKYSMKNILDNNLLNSTQVNLDVFATFYPAFSNFYPHATLILSIDPLSISETLEKLTTADDKLRHNEDFLYFSYQYNEIMSENPNRRSPHYREMSSYTTYTKSSKLDDKDKIYNETMEETQEGDILLPKRMSSYLGYTKQALTKSDKGTMFPE